MFLLPRKPLALMQLMNLPEGNKESIGPKTSREVEKDAKKTNDIDQMDDELNDVLNFLRDRIPDDEEKDEELNAKEEVKFEGDLQDENVTIGGDCDFMEKMQGFRSGLAS
eukprot:Gb_32645 [translate_table: standard]